MQIEKPDFSNSLRLIDSQFDVTGLNTFFEGCSEERIKGMSAGLGVH